MFVIIHCSTTFLVITFVPSHNSLNIEKFDNLKLYFFTLNDCNLIKVLRNSDGR